MAGEWNLTIEKEGKVKKRKSAPDISDMYIHEALPQKKDWKRIAKDSRDLPLFRVDIEPKSPNVNKKLPLKAIQMLRILVELSEEHEYIPFDNIREAVAGIKRLRGTRGAILCTHLAEMGYLEKYARGYYNNLLASDINPLPSPRYYNVHYKVIKTQIERRDFRGIV